MKWNRLSGLENRGESKKTGHHQSIDWWHARLRARVGFLTMLFPLYVLVDVYHQ
ncbi:hypothetical protein HYX11_00845 [Candidatus Woesearchaeota archaeon]|nr:hypothetical protein [Candidatus Woesearchaeota archaeon]